MAGSRSRRPRPAERRAAAVVVDYERAWTELQALIAEKPQHGREPTLVAMAEIAQRCRVPAGELSKLLRLYGVEVDRARSIATESVVESGDFAGGSSSPGDTELAAHHRTEVHDGGSNGNGRARGRV